MPPSTRMQRNRQRAAERAILGKIEENATQIGSSLKRASNSTRRDSRSSVPINKMESEIFDPTDGFDGLNPDHMRSIIDDLETEIHRRIGLINDEREKARNFLKQEGRVMMFRFPMAAKQMTVGEFLKNYGIDLKTMDFGSSDQNCRLLEGGGSKRVKLLPGETSSSLPNGRFETPARLANFTRKDMTPATALRSAKKDERIYSKNGSPLNDVEVGFMSATLGRKRSAVDADGTSGVNLNLHLGDGNYMQMCPENIEKLDKEMKNIAFKQLQILKENLETIESCLHNEQ